MIWLPILIIIVCCVFLSVSHHSQLGGDAISVRAGPVDMLIQPKQLLMDGYRFQNTMFPPIEYNKESVTECQPIDRQRVGIFKAKAYIDQDLYDQEQVGGNGGSTQGASAATMGQLRARGEQDVYLTGNNGDPIIDSTNPFGQWVRCAPYGSPEEMREINYPNKIFSWGDVIHRYYSST